MSPQKGLLLALVAVAMVPMLVLLLIITSVANDQSSQPGTAGVVCSPSPGPDGSIAGYRGVQLENAAHIVHAGQTMRLPQPAWVIAVAVAMQESGLIVRSSGDAAGPDSRGLFQQRDSWGPLAVRLDPEGSARLFYLRLIALRDPTWDQAPSLTAANNPAQRVQSSQYPFAYARHEQEARAVVGSVLGASCPAPGGGANPPNPNAKVVIDRAMSQVGVRYAWGGGTAAGPSMGWGPDAGVTGFDCSGLALYAYAGAGVSVPHQTQAIWSSFQPPITDRSKLLPGDLLLLSENGTPSAVHHVGIYLGNGQVVDAPQSGSTVGVRSDIWRPGSYYATEFLGAVRPGVAMPGQD